MSTQTKNKILVIAVAILLLTNMAMLFFFLKYREHGKKGWHGDHEAIMSGFLQKQVGFTPQQIQQYDTLSKEHRDKMKAMFDEAGKNRESQLKQLAAAGFSDSAINSTAEQSSGKQKILAVSMFQHLRDVRGLCTPAQVPVFDSLVSTILGRHDERKK